MDRPQTHQALKSDDLSPKLPKTSQSPPEIVTYNWWPFTEPWRHKRTWLGRAPVPDQETHINQWAYCSWE